jgi:hypothetical protein
LFRSDETIFRKNSGERQGRLCSPWRWVNLTMGDKVHFVHGDYPESGRGISGNEFAVARFRGEISFYLVFWWKIRNCSCRERGIIPFCIILPSLLSCLTQEFNCNKILFHPYFNDWNRLKMMSRKIQTLEFLFSPF